MFFVGVPDPGTRNCPDLLINLIYYCYYLNLIEIIFCTAPLSGRGRVSAEIEPHAQWWESRKPFLKFPRQLFRKFPEKSDFLIFGKFPEISGKHENLHYISHHWFIHFSASVTVLGPNLPKQTCFDLVPPLSLPIFLEIWIFLKVSVNFLCFFRKFLESAFPEIS